MVKIALDAGHGMSTPGKRTPEGEREWTFNDKVVRAAIAKLNEYEKVQILRVDDPTGVTDISLRTRTDRANIWKADVYVSCHHNANTGRWGSWTGVETYTMDHPHANPKSVEIANAVQPLVVKAMGLHDRGLKKENFHVLRETNMPAILIEGGYMDSTIDIKALRDDAKLKAQGEALSEGLAVYYGLKRKAGVKGVSLPREEGVKLFNTGSLTLNNEFKEMLVKAREKGIIKSDQWENKAADGTLTESEAIGLTAIAVKRAYFDEI